MHESVLQSKDTKFISFPLLIKQKIISDVSVKMRSFEVQLKISKSMEKKITSFSFTVEAIINHVLFEASNHLGFQGSKASNSSCLYLTILCPFNSIETLLRSFSDTFCSPTQTIQSTCTLSGHWTFQKMHFQAMHLRSIECKSLPI